jgi:hypothetical protein
LRRCADVSQVILGILSRIARGYVAFGVIRKPCKLSLAGGREHGPLHTVYQFDTDLGSMPNTNSTKHHCPGAKKRIADISAGNCRRDRKLKYCTRHQWICQTQPKCEGAKKVLRQAEEYEAKKREQAELRDQGAGASVPTMDLNRYFCVEIDMIWVSCKPWTSSRRATAGKTLERQVMGPRAIHTVLLGVCQ